jgi:hypothetical protein
MKDRQRCDHKQTLKMLAETESELLKEGNFAAVKTKIIKQLCR